MSYYKSEMKIQVAVHQNCRKHFLLIIEMSPPTSLPWKVSDHAVQTTSLAPWCQFQCWVLSGHILDLELLGCNPEFPQLSKRC